MKLAARCVLFALSFAALACPAPAARSGDHCAADARITAIAGAPGAFEVGTAAGRTTARWPAASPATTPPGYVIRALDHGWGVVGSAVNVESTTSDRKSVV